MEDSTNIDKPSDILKHINLPAGFVAKLDGPFILSASVRHGKTDLATLFRVTGIDIHSNKFVAVSTVDPTNLQRFPYEAKSEDDDGTVNTVWATGQQAFAFAKASGYRMATA